MTLSLLFTGTVMLIAYVQLSQAQLIQMQGRMMRYQHERTALEVLQTVGKQPALAAPPYSYRTPDGYTISTWPGNFMIAVTDPKTHKTYDIYRRDLKF